MIEKSGIQIKLGAYGVASSTALHELSILPKVQDYRRKTSSRMYALDRTDIQRKISSANYHVSRKIDGEFTVLVFNEGLVFSINPGGTVRVGLPWMNEAAELLGRSRLKSAMIAGEFHVCGIEDRRARVHDVIRIARQPESQKQLNQLAFAVFDIIEINGEPLDEDYSEVWNRIRSIFDDGKLVYPVETLLANSPDDIEKLFAKWIDRQGAEGLVVRSDIAGFFKVKPRHTLDAVVIGFTESADDRQGMLHDLLLAVMRSDGALHVLGRVGGGFSDDDRRGFLSDLKDMVVESEYAEVNSDHVAYQMVTPKWVVEISCLDLISQTTRGAPVNRMALNWNAKSKHYQVIRRLPLVSVISPQFVRRREDKSVNPVDIRITQISDIVEVPLVDRDATQMTLPKSQILRREVYTKELKGETMVRKFLMWKTNKENESDEFPAYVVHYTDFSPNRKIPLARDIRVSSSEAQINDLWVGLKNDNIKKGWEPFDSVKSAVGSVAKEKPRTKSTTAKKSTAKQSPAKKSTKAAKAASETAVKKASAKKASTRKTTIKNTSTSRPKNIKAGTKKNNN